MSTRRRTPTTVNRTREHARDLYLAHLWDPDLSLLSAEEYYCRRDLWQTLTVLSLLETPAVYAGILGDPCEQEAKAAIERAHSDPSGLLSLVWDQFRWWALTFEGPSEKRDVDLASWDWAGRRRQEAEAAAARQPPLPGTEAPDTPAPGCARQPPPPPARPSGDYSKLGVVPHFDLEAVRQKVMTTIRNEFDAERLPQTVSRREFLSDAIGNRLNWLSVEGGGPDRYPVLLSCDPMYVRACGPAWDPVRRLDALEEACQAGIPVESAEAWIRRHFRPYWDTAPLDDLPLWRRFCEWVDEHKGRSVTGERATTAEGGKFAPLFEGPEREASARRMAVGLIYWMGKGGPYGCKEGWHLARGWRSRRKRLERIAEARKKMQAGEAGR